MQLRHLMCLPNRPVHLQMYVYFYTAMGRRPISIGQKKITNCYTEILIEMNRHGGIGQV